MARTDPQVNLRIPAALKAKLEASALANGRSITAEVVARLEASYEKRDSDSVDSQLRAINENVEYLVSLAEGRAPDRKAGQTTKGKSRGR